MFIMMTMNAYKQVPYSTIESAELDGAGHFTIMFKILLPQAMGLVTFTASADLDEAMTVTVWADDVKMSMLGVDEWTIPEGHWEQTFIMTIPDDMSLESFFGCLEIHFDGKAGWRT